jgi:transcriptional regulator with XRE-family HTH domain
MLRGQKMPAKRRGRVVKVKMDEKKMKAAERIKNARDKILKRTQTALAYELGVHPGTISRWERGIISDPRSRALIVLAQRAGTTPEYLLGESDEFRGTRSDIGMADARRRKRGTKAIQQIKRLVWSTGTESERWAQLEALLDQLVPWTDKDWDELLESGLDYFVVEPEIPKEKKPERKKKEA